MSLPNELHPLQLAASSGGGYEIEQSLRFDGSSKLSRTPSSAGTTTTWTLSYWIKVGSLTAEQAILSAPAPGGGYTATWYSAGGTSRVKINQYNHPTNVYSKCPTPVYRDPSAWFHVVVVYDSTNATADDRVRFYVNGVRLTDFSDDGSSVGGTTNPSQNQTSGINNNSIQYIGSQYDGTYAFTNSYLAEMHLLDGTAVTNAEDFGELDANGVWRPIEVSGVTYGTNGWYMKFDPSATNGIGHDHSGNGNNFTPSGFTTSGTGTDVMDDTPTTNWATFNPLVPGASSFSNGNLTVTANGSGSQNRGTPFPTIKLPDSGKWYAEFTPSSIGEIQIGLVQGKSTTGAVGDTVAGYYRLGNISVEGTGTVETVASFTNGDVIGVIVNADDQEIRFSKNGTIVTTQAWDYSSAPNSSNCYLSFKQGSSSGSCTAAANYGAQGFAHTPPTGYKALNTANLPAPDIADGSKYFNTVLYDGTNTSNSITGVGFSPDFVWIKPRDNADHHRLNTTTQGANRTLSSNLTGGEYGPANAYLDSFDSDGFTVSGSDNGWNNSSHDYVAWNWKEGAIPGFEIVTYTGNGYPTSNTQNISHNLGVAPSFITIKNRDRDSQWLHYVKPLGATKGMEGWHDGDTAYTNSNYFANTEPTSAQFTVGSDSGGNWQGDDFIAFLWAEVEGFFKVGTYERNGSTDGPFIYLGFTPALIIIKEYESGGEGWPIYDNKRLGYNPNDTPMFINATTTETYIQSTYPNEIDFLSNGFKIRNNDSRQNSTLSSYRYLYWAWAVNPFGGSGVSPATAR